MSYVALKHLLADLTLEAVRDPTRAAWVFAAQAGAELITPEHPQLRRSDCLERARTLAAPVGWKPTERDIARLVRAGLLTGRGELLALAPAFVPHLDYFQRHTPRLARAICALRDAPPQDPATSTGARSTAARPVEDAVHVAAVLFNAGLFFECHEWGEDLWKAAAGEPREFYHGLVQVAAAFYHHEKGNRHGSRTLLDKGLRRLAPYPDRYLGLDLRRVRTELARWAAHFAGAPRPRRTPRFHTVGENTTGAPQGERVGWMEARGTELP